MQNLYKFRFIPFGFGVLTLGIVLVCKYVLLLPISSFLLKFSIGFFVVGFFFMQVLRELKREKDAPPPPVKTEEEELMDNMNIAEYDLKNEIPFLAVKALFCFILFLGGLSTIIDGSNPLFGLVVAALATPLFLVHIHWIRQNIRGIKKIKEERNK